MSRETEFETLVNPASHYVSWASNEKSFRFYDKTAKEKTIKELPTEFIIVKQASAVKGWNDSANEGIFSNIITNVSTQVLRVRSGKGLVAEGLYADIKEKVKSLGGHYEAKVFAVFGDSVVMIEFKGAVLGEWATFLKTNSNKIGGHKIVINKFDDRKKGAVKYTVPVFEIGKPLTADEKKLANRAYDLSKGYLEKAGELSQVASVVADEVPNHEAPALNNGQDENDDLPF